MVLQRETIDRAPGGWQPPGRRWGTGSESVLPYLSHSLQSRMLVVNQSIREDGPVRNPVFAEMTTPLTPSRKH